MAKGLIFCNDEGSLPTFSGVSEMQDETDIDIALGCVNIQVRNWKVYDESNRLLMFDIGEV